MISIRLDKKKGMAGALIGVLICTACCLWLSPIGGTLFAAMFLAAGALKIKVSGKTGGYILNILWALACVFITCYASSEVFEGLNFLVIEIRRMLLNLVCVLLVCLVCFLITGSWKGSFVTGTLLMMLLATINGAVYQFRGKELAFSDFRSAGTALSVVSQYRLELVPSMVYGWLLWGVVAFGGSAVPQWPGRGALRARLVTGGVLVLSILTLIAGASEIPVKTWKMEGTGINGYYLNFYLGIRDASVEKPEEYGVEALGELEQAYPAAGDGETGPNIIVIMNEAFSDLNVLGNSLNTDQPVTPYLESLEENIIRGYALTSVFGGNTANSEFEFLTSTTMGFLPNGSVPYQQYIQDDMFSLAWLLNTYGYTNFATHPFHATGWSRDRVYPGLGFGESTFLESYPQKNLIREKVSDQEMYEYLLQTLAGKAEENLFLFGVTMQNHGGYEYEDFTSTVHLEGYSGAYPMAEQYLSLIRESDRALEYLLSELEDYPEDAVVLVFGDHQPKVESAFYEEVHGGTYDTLDEQMRQYMVPFFIWANYDIPEQTVQCTSLNYLGRYLLEAAGLELPSYYRFLAELEANIPALNAMGYYSLSEGKFVPFADASGEEAEWLNRYAMAQYNSLFDRDNLSETFFGQYLPDGE